MNQPYWTVKSSAVCCVCDSPKESDVILESSAVYSFEHFVYASRGVMCVHPMP